MRLPKRNFQALSVVVCLVALVMADDGAFAQHMSVVYGDGRSHGPPAILLKNGRFVPFIVVPSFGQPNSPLQRSSKHSIPYLGDLPLYPPSIYGGFSSAAGYFGHPNPELTNKKDHFGFGRAFVLPDASELSGGTAPSVMLALRTDARAPGQSADVPTAGTTPPTPLVAVLVGPPVPGAATRASTAPASEPVVSSSHPPAPQPASALTAAVGLDDSRHALSYLPVPRRPTNR